MQKRKQISKFVNKDSLEKKFKSLLSQTLKNAKMGDHYQFQRIGYFTPDKDSTADQLIFPEQH